MRLVRLTLHSSGMPGMASELLADSSPLMRHTELLLSSCKAES